jgi:hypothetical protein
MARDSADVVYAPRELPRANEIATHPQVLQVSRDYTAATSYVAAFYGQAKVVHDEMIASSERAIAKFFLISSMPPQSVAPPLVYQLIRVALGVLPATAMATRVFDALSKCLPLAQDPGRLKEVATLLKTAAATTAQRGAAMGMAVYTMPPDSQHARAVLALDQLGVWSRQGTAEILRQRDDALTLLEALKDRCRGNLERHFKGALGNWAQYDETKLEKFEKYFELNLYKELYGKKMSVFITGKSEEVQGAPAGVVGRIRALTKMPTDRTALLAIGIAPPVRIAAPPPPRLTGLPRYY